LTAGKKNHLTAVDTALVIDGMTKAEVAVLPRRTKKSGRTVPTRPQ